ncbi:VOC family protein [Thalassotalea profundi]|uniref:Lactoylglutathione lyase n=1 Tax=Thalassotalea profundi TaxID=2036687 RepID=A0ABQ3IF26_9GAMM|nr:VOC family protein [Thalassotalea profundi]GHE78651.1 lactoylglutathione lyase [Thalassotalea profundi]
MKFLHTMVRVSDLEESLNFYINQLGLIETKRVDVPEGKFTLIYLATALGEPEIELTHNWGSTEEYKGGRNFGHIAFAVDDIYQLCQKLMDSGVVINRPPRCGHMAFIKSPDGISVELLQTGEALAPQEPWLSMENQGTW